MPQELEMTQAALGGLGPWELGIIFVIVLIIFGAGRLPSIGKGLGQAIQNFKKGLKGESSETNSRETNNKEGKKDKPPHEPN